MSIIGVFGHPSGWARVAVRTAFVAAVAVAATGVDLPASAGTRGEGSGHIPEAGPEAIAADAPTGADPLTAPDAVTALTIARLEGAPVEVLGERTETGSVFALPDGTMAARMSSGPVWVRRGGEGTQAADWEPVDLTLVKGADGTIRPAAHPGDLSLSAGAPKPDAAAPDELVTVAEVVAPDGSSTALTWVGALPEPRLEGSRAVYDDVEPGVDLVVDVTATGFEQFFVVNERPTAGTELSLPLGVTADGASAQPGRAGGVDIVSADGSVAARVGEARMWDADADAGRAHPVTAPWKPLALAGAEPPMPDWATLRTAASAANPGRGKAAPQGRSGQGPATVNPGDTPGAAKPYDEAVPVDTEIAQVDSSTIAMDLQPQLDVLQDPDTTFPLVIDPEVYLGIGFDTTVQSNASNDMSAEGLLLVGSWNGGSTVTRSFLRVDTSPIRGKRVLDARLELYDYYSYSCQARNWEVWHTGDVSTDTRWTTQPTWISQQAVVSGTRGYSPACAGDWVTAPVSGAMAWAATHNYQTMTLGLRASDEGDSYAWKKFLSSENGAGGPAVWVNYASNPETPTSLKVSPVGDTTNGVAYTSTTTPTLTANVNDADGGSLSVTFEVLKGSTVEASGTVSAPAGAVAQWKVPAGELADGAAYTLRVTSSDGVAKSAAATKQFAVDSTAPAAPFIASTDFPIGSARDAAPGTAGTFTLTHAQAADGSLVKFRWALNASPDPAKTVAVTAGSTSTTLSVTPTNYGRQVLRVQAVDRAGNVSGVAEYTFYVGHTGAILAPADGQTVGEEVRIELAPPAGGYTRVEIMCDFVDSSPDPHSCPGTFTTGAGAPWANNADGNIPGPGEYIVWRADRVGVDSPENIRIAAFFDGPSVAPAATQWPAVFVDPGRLRAATAAVGPGSVNLATGDHVLSATDVEEFGLVASRTASSREPRDGFEKQAELLLGTQASASSLAGIYPGYSTVAIDTAFYRSGGASLRITPAATTSPYGSYASVGGDVGAMRLGMRAGHTYEISGWIYDPWSAAQPLHDRGLRLAVFAGPGNNTYSSWVSPRPGVACRWQRLSLTVTIPQNSTEAFLRLYNGYAGGSNKYVNFDDLSVREVWAPFGPQWSSGVEDGATSTAFTRVSQPYPDVAAVGLVGGGDIYFLRDNGGPWRPMAGAEGLTLTQSVSGGAATGWTLTEIDGTITTFAASSGTKDFPVATTSPAVTDATATRYVYEIVGGINRLKRIIAPIELGVAGTPNAPAPCTGEPPAVGCEVLEYVYATTTSATASAFGDVAGQVESIRVSTTPDITAARASWRTVACYAYDATGHLRRVWDPRITNGNGDCPTVPPSGSLYTEYSYDDAGRVTTVKPSGEPAYTFAYGAIGSDANAGRLLTVSRPSLVQGTTSQEGPVNTTRVVYGVPLTRAAGGPYDLDAQAIGKWAQKDGPVIATAIFGPQFDPGASVAAVGSPSVDQYHNAEVHYLDPLGLEVNTASPIGDTRSPETGPSDQEVAAGYIDTTEYNARGAVVRTLDATNRLAALHVPGSAFDALAQWGLQDRESPELAQILDTRNTYSADGMDLLESLGPVQSLAVANDPGQMALLRPVTTNLYDPATADLTGETKPDGAAYHLLARTTSAGRPDGGGPDVDVVNTVYTYNPIDGASPLGRSSGWIHRQPTSVTVAAGTPNALTAKVLYDTRGRIIESRRPGSSGNDAATTKTRYYQAAQDTADPLCSGRPDWAGTPCITAAAGNVTGYDSARMAGQLPSRRVESYNVFGTPTKVTEVGPSGVSRTTTTTYDSADRVTSVQITGTSAGVSIPTTTTSYDAASGDVIAVSGTGTGGTSASITREYDALGRLVAYGDADGGRTETEYDSYGKPVKERQLQGGQLIGSRTFEYDRDLEPRGLLTAIDDSVAGRIAATWGPDGQLLTEQLPGGVTLSITYDPATVPVQRTYTRTSDEAVIWTDRALENHRGQWIRHTSTTGEAAYAYDELGRLAGVTDRVAGVNTCSLRTYGYDTHSNRTSFTIATGAAGANLESAVCPTEPGPVTTSAYDTADRLVSGYGGSAWVYDALGRITSMPSAADSSVTVQNAYYVNDLVASQTVPGTARVEWGLDPIQRRDVYEEFAWINGAWASTVKKVSHYSSDSDEPGWIVEDAAEPDSAVTRYVSGVEGDLAVSTTKSGGRELQLVDLHGDVVGTLPIADGAVEASWVGLSFSRADEFGNPVALTGGASANAPPARYGWLGAAQRSAEALGGVILMGVRLYHPGTGRFMSVDPVAGGSASAYDYCSADPVNCTDLDGQWGINFSSLLKVVTVVAEVASNVPGPIGAAAAGLGAVAYAVQGNTTQALIMGATAAAALVGAGAVVRGVSRAVTAARAVGQSVARAAPRVARSIAGAARRVNLTLKQRYAGHLSDAYNAGRARVTMPNRFGRTHVDLRGKAHFSKPQGRHVQTPHVVFQFRNPRAPSGYGRLNGDPTQATWGQLLRVRSYLRGAR